MCLITVLTKFLKVSYDTHNIFIEIFRGKCVRIFSSVAVYTFSKYSWYNRGYIFLIWLGYSFSKHLLNKYLYTRQQRVGTNVHYYTHNHWCTQCWPITYSTNVLWRGPELRTSKLMKARSGVCGLCIGDLIYVAGSSWPRLIRPITLATREATKLSCRLNHRSNCIVVALRHRHSSAVNVSLSVNPQWSTFIRINLVNSFCWLH